jgi:hydrogenase expression/formation protein HypE
MTTDKILLDHGSGGKISHSLTKDMMLPVFDNDILAALNDGAIFELAGSRLAFSTDSYFFPGRKYRRPCDQRNGQ